MTKQVYSFEQTIEATKDTRGFWVSNHREIIKPYLTERAEKIGWTKVLAGLEDTVSIKESPRRLVLRRCMRLNIKDGL